MFQDSYFYSCQKLVLPEIWRIIEVEVAGSKLGKT